MATQAAILAGHGKPSSASSRSASKAAPAHGKSSTDKPALPGAGQLQLTRDGQTLLLSVEQSAHAVLFIKDYLPQAQYLKTERIASVSSARKSGRVSQKDMLIYKIPADHQHTMALITLGEQIRDQGKQLRVTNEATRTHFYTHKKLAADRKREAINSRETPILPVAMASQAKPPATTPESDADQGSVLPVLGVSAPRTSKEVKPSRRVREDAANIEVMTGRTSTNAKSATALKIRAPRAPGEETLLANGHSNEGLYELVMAQPGAEYVKGTKGRGTTPPRAGYFRVPISETTPTLLNSLINQFGLTVEKQAPTLNTSTIDAIQHRLNDLKLTYQLSNQDDLPEYLNTTLVAPEGLDYLPYQKAGIAYALKLGNALIADEPGLGKTIQAVGVSNALPDVRTILIMAPASLKINWNREFEKWDTKGLSVGRVADGKPDSWPDTDVVVINFDLVEQHYDRLTEKPWDILVIDEAHALKNEDAKRTRAILGHGSGQKREPGIPPLSALLSKPRPNRQHQHGNHSHHERILPKALRPKPPR